MGIRKIATTGGDHGAGPAITVLALLLLAGCSTVTAETRRYPEAGVYMATPYENVAILRTPPQGHYLRLGEIHVQPQEKTSQAEILKAFKKEAGKIGADAVLLVADPAMLTGGPVAGAEWWNRELAAGPGRTIVGIALWYPRPVW